MNVRLLDLIAFQAAAFHLMTFIQHVSNSSLGHRLHYHTLATYMNAGLATAFKRKTRRICLIQM